MPDMMMTAKTRFTLQLLACSLMWSSGFLFMKAMADEVDPFAMASARAAIAAAILSLWFLSRKQSPLPTRRELMPWLVLGTLNGWLPNVLTAWALERAGAGPSAMIQASGPLMVAVMAHFVFAEERLTIRRLVGVLIGFLGMGLLIGPQAFDAAAGFAGAIAMVIVSLCYAVGNIYARGITHVEPSRMGLGQQIVSASVATVLTFSLSGGAAYQPIAVNWHLMLALGVLATALPITLFMHLIRNDGPTKAAMIGYLLPVFATIMAVVFLGEVIGWREMIGGAIVLAGVYVVTTAPRAARI